MDMVNSTLIDTTLVLSLDGGLNKEAKPVIKKKTFRNVKVKQLTASSITLQKRLRR